MKRLLSSKVFIAALFFILGVIVDRGVQNYYALLNTPNSRIPDPQFPFNPEDFEIDKNFKGASTVGLLSQREDGQFVYYEIPLNENIGDKHKLNVDIKDGVIKISEELKSDEEGSVETSSERIFTIDPALDSTKAQVINEKNKIVIKIPKK